jgi:hypothetical protein
MVHDTSARPNIHPTVPPQPPQVAPAPPPPPPPPPPAGRARAPARAAVDTALVRALLGQRPVPTDKIVIRLAQPLQPETRYAVVVTGATNLIGKKGDGEIGFSTPKPVVADTTHRAPRTRRP